MDTHWLDSLARSLTQPRSRRGLTAALVGSLGLLGRVAPDVAAAGRGCKRPCGECGYCKKGRCRTKDGKKVCQRGRCKERPDGTPCTGGSCFVGSCFPAT
jgi:hypothetical protein